MAMGTGPEQKTVLAAYCLDITDLPVAGGVAAPSVPIDRRPLIIVPLAEQPELRGIARRLGEPKVAEGVRRQQPPARRALHEALLHQERLDDVLDGVARLARAPPRWSRCPPGRRRNSPRSGQIAPVEPVEAALCRPPAAVSAPSATSRIDRRSPSPTVAKSRTRRSRRPAMRGVPRRARDLARAFLGVSVACRASRAPRLTICDQFLDRVEIEPHRECRSGRAAAW